MRLPEIQQQRILYLSNNAELQVNDVVQLSGLSRMSVLRIRAQYGIGRGGYTLPKPRPRRPEQEAGLRVHYCQYKSSDNAKDLGFSLTYEQFCSIVSLPCYYCGVEYELRPVRKNITLRSNGVDRQDNLIGYHFDNCVPCCTICNKAKRNLSLDDFRDWMKRLTLFRVEQGDLS